MEQSNYNRTGGLKNWEINKLNRLKNEMIQTELMSMMCMEDVLSSNTELIVRSRIAYDATQEFITYLRHINDRYLSYPNNNIYANGLREYIINEMITYKVNDDGYSAYIFHKAVSESGCKFLINALKEVDSRVREAM